MQQGNIVRLEQCLRRKPVVIVGLAFQTVLLLNLLLVHISVAQEQGQRTFRTAEEAGSALFAASQNEDEKALMDILGPAAKNVVSSGDPAEDRKDRNGFVAKYQEMHRYVKTVNGTILYVGAENWPLPIPLVNRRGLWYFDTSAGKEEILMRRIGGNEFAAIDVLHELAAREEQAAKLSADDFHHPIDVLMAMQGEENATTNNGQGESPTPFKGYFFCVLPNQEKNASGSAKTQLVKGKTLHGFAFVAYPAEYRSSGVMTFIVNQGGVVYEKDLGADTPKLAKNMVAYDPDSSWRPVD